MWKAENSIGNIKIIEIFGVKFGFKEDLESFQKIFNENIKENKG